jgi:hypothetical protein
VITKPFTRTCSLWLATLLMGVLALGPFLHAHYGHMQVTGFHVNGLESVTPVSPISSPSDQLTFTLPADPESPAVGVATSLPRFEESESIEDAFPEHSNWALMDFFSCRLLALVSPPLAWVPLFFEQVLGSFQAGAPPPAQAPPR